MGQSFINFEKLFSKDFASNIIFLLEKMRFVIILYKNHQK